MVFWYDIVLEINLFVPVKDPISRQICGLVQYYSLQVYNLKLDVRTSFHGPENMGKDTKIDFLSQVFLPN